MNKCKKSICVTAAVWSHCGQYFKIAQITSSSQFHSFLSLSNLFHSCFGCECLFIHKWSCLVSCAGLVSFSVEILPLAFFPSFSTEMLRLHPDLLSIPSRLSWRHNEVWYNFILMLSKVMLIRLFRKIARNFEKSDLWFSRTWTIRLTCQCVRQCSHRKLYCVFCLCAKTEEVSRRGGCAVLLEKSHLGSFYTYYWTCSFWWFIRTIDVLFSNSQHLHTHW